MSGSGDQDGRRPNIEPSLKGTLPGPSSRPAKPSGGRRFGPYVLKTRLGGGGMGDVYQAWEPARDRQIAVKLLRRDMGADAAEQRLVREATAITQLDHPNVISIHDVGRVDGQVYLAMEWIKGESLDAWAAEPRSWREIVSAYRSAGAGLAAAHSAGLVHRDFKPTNVMIGDDGRIVVMDFGLVRANSNEEMPGRRITARGEILGTPAFMAPEQFESADVGPAADQFAFCVSLWRALYGTPPYGESASERVYAMTHGTLSTPEPSGVPPWVDAILMRGLSIKPQDRFPSMDALLLAMDWGLGRRKVGARVGVALVVAALAAVELAVAFGAW